LAHRLQRLEAVRLDGRVDADALGGAVVDGDEYATWPSSTVSPSRQSSCRWLRNALTNIRRE